MVTQCCRSVTKRICTPEREEKGSNNDDVISSRHIISTIYCTENYLYNILHLIYNAIQTYITYLQQKSQTLQQAESLQSVIGGYTGGLANLGIGSLKADVQLTYADLSAALLSPGFSRSEKDLALLYKHVMSAACGKAKSKC